MVSSDKADEGYICDSRCLCYVWVAKQSHTCALLQARRCLLCYPNSFVTVSPAVFLGIEFV